MSDHAHSAYFLAGKQGRKHGDSPKGKFDRETFPARGGCEQQDIGAIGALMNIVHQPRTLPVRGLNAGMGTGCSIKPPLDPHIIVGLALRAATVSGRLVQQAITKRSNASPRA